MPSVSNRGKSQVQSPIRSLVPFADKSKADGVEILHLNIGQPDIVTPAAALNRIKNLEEDIIKYGPSAGEASLRKKVAAYYDEINIPISEEHVYVTTGASEAIQFALFSCFDPGDEIIIPEPFYANYLGYAQISQVNIIPITSSFDRQFALPSPENFSSLIGENTRAIFLCNPGNPTGQLYTKEELEALVEVVQENDLYLIVDEVYREFCYDREFTSVLQFDSISENVIVIDSISKVFSSCGARVGYLITRSEELRNVIDKYAQLRLCPPALGQIMAEACYTDYRPYINEAKEEYNRRRKVLYSRLSKIEGVKCYYPSAAFYNMAELPIDDATKFCKWMLTDFRHQGRTVMFAPADGFYFNQELGKKQVRIAFILNEEKLNQAMDCLEIALEEYKTIMSQTLQSYSYK